MLTDATLREIADKTGTPVHVLDGDGIADKLGSLTAAIKSDPRGDRVQLRYAMKANPVRAVLDQVRNAGVWIDAGSGNEVARATLAGFTSSHDTPQITLSCDVLRDQAAASAVEHGALAVIGSPAMVDDLIAAGYTGNVGVRVNPGFGHGHVDSCDTGGPSSKHGIWFEHLAAAVERAQDAGLRVTMLHAHVGSGPQPDEYMQTTTKLIGELASLLKMLPDVTRVSLGGGLPVPYRKDQDGLDIAALAAMLHGAVDTFADAAGRPITVELEPGRWFVAENGVIVTRVHDVKPTEANAKGRAHMFVMVDAGFVDLIRPAMYGSWHGIRSLEEGAEDGPRAEMVVAGPLCESGDVFTRDEEELLVPRQMPHATRGDLWAITHSGAYGTAMSSNYLSIGRAPVVMHQGGVSKLISRRESLTDVLNSECSTTLD